jgi:hypothetical protein
MGRVYGTHGEMNAYWTVVKKDRRKETTREI